VVELITTPGESRDRLSQFAYTTLEPGNPLGLLQEALELSREHEPLERRLRQARKEGLIHTDYLGLQIDEAEKAQVISKAEARNLREYHDKVSALLDVDDFTTEELARVPLEKAATAPAKKPSKTKAASKKRAPAKRAASKKAVSKKKTEQS
jgi:acyl-CoA dehydrogenase